MHGPPLAGFAVSGVLLSKWLMTADESIRQPATMPQQIPSVESVLQAAASALLLRSRVMQQPTYDQLAAMVLTYEDALRRIAAKPAEWALVSALPVHAGDSAERAYKKCARIATIALWDHHPEIREETLRQR